MKAGVQYCRMNKVLRGIDFHLCRQRQACHQDVPLHFRTIQSLKRCPVVKAERAGQLVMGIAIYDGYIATILEVFDRAKRLGHGS